jgi:hypothetical protein
MLRSRCDLRDNKLGAVVAFPLLLLFCPATGDDLSRGVNDFDG